MQTQELYQSASQIPAPVPAMTPPQPPARSRLGQLTLSLSLLAVGVLWMADLSGAGVPASAYFATPLAVAGLGLVAGAWFGRARWLIAVGAVLTLCLTIVTFTESVGRADGSVTWRPASLEQMQSIYKVDLGNATLDLTGVDFTGREQAVRVEVDAGNLTIILPREVDVRGTVTVDVGNANVLGTTWGGIGQSERAVSDVGDDGPGGGLLVLRASVDVGNLEVRR